MAEEMEAYSEEDLPAEQFEPLIEYVMKLQGDQVVDEALAAKGAALWEDELECNACHEVEPGEEGDGPNLSSHGSQAWVTRVIRDSSQADLFGEYAAMPKFGDKLSAEDINALAAFVVMQRGQEPVEVSAAAVVAPAPAPAEPAAEPAPAEGEPAADGEAPGADGEPVPADAAAADAPAPEGEPDAEPEAVPAAAAADAEPEPAPAPEKKPKAAPKPKPKPAKPAADKANGRKLYMAKCKSCHGTDGKGDTKFGKKLELASITPIGQSKIKKAVTNGVAGTKMKSYKKKLTPQEIDDVSAFAKSL